jgi:hypothetical protein
MKMSFEERVGNLYEQLYNTVRVTISDDKEEDIDIALSAINSLAISVAIQNNVSRKLFLKNIAYLFDQITALNEADRQELH